MDEKGEPDPGMRVVTLVSLVPQEAALMAGRLEAEGIRAMVSPSDALGPWTALLGAGAGAAANLLQQGTAAVLVDERDLERARRIAERYLT